MKAKKEKSKHTLETLFELPVDLAETSGCIVFDSLIWTFNDKGNRSELYGVSLETGEILKTVVITNADNVDWEDIAQDSASIYIGDFGNNYGDRTDLCIYIIQKSQLGVKENQSIAARQITFTYGDQDDFKAARFTSSYDCEAMFIKNDTIYLMTKDWLEETSSVYTIPCSVDNYIVQKTETVNTNGLVTGADYNSETKQLIVCGYADYLPFIWFYDLSQGKSIANAEAQRINLDEYFGHQFEGVSFFNDGAILTNEASAVANQSAWMLNFSESE